MTDQNIWRKQLASIRSRFESAANSFSGVRCYLCRESSDSEQPISIALAQHCYPSENLRPFIGYQADGIVSTHTGWNPQQTSIFHWWFVHEAMAQAESAARLLVDMGQETHAQSISAANCERMFRELATEGAKLLKHMPTVFSSDLTQWISDPRSTANEMLWIVTLFQIAREESNETLLRTSVMSPRTVDVDMLAATGDGELPDSVIQTLDQNPFSGSISLIDFLLSHQGGCPLPLEDNGFIDRCPIPAEYRTREMTKGEAARFWGHKSSNPPRWITRRIDEGKLTAFRVSSKAWIFDIREFPKAVHEKLVS